MHSQSVNYFTCTLGEACQAKRPYRNVDHLIEEQSRSNPDLPAIGFYTFSGAGPFLQLKHEILSFKDVANGVSATAELLRPILNLPDGDTVGLLCSSSPEFFFVWLACIKLGHPVLLIAPQCSPKGIVGLCDETGVSALLVDGKNQELGRKALEQRPDGRQASLRCERIPLDENSVFSIPSIGSSETSLFKEAKGRDVAYFHHTSGTSSGVSKPIPQSHHGAVGALPALNGRTKATFTTTPLYHGGPADIFRAWTSDAMVWLFPSKDIPITASNVIRCLESANQASQSHGRFPIKYLASVPYILQMMAEDSKGLESLQQMDLVSVGGAALPQEVGDELVKRGVNLVSRFGSAECGFLLSSHRDYCRDKEWQYLRSQGNSMQLRFDLRERGLSELVVLPGWPHMAKRNREDGSFATSDLFQPHERIENAWRYHSRADAQLTLITGKKFDPEPLEAALVAHTPHISDALVFGNGRAYPGSLLFRSLDAACLTDEDLIEAVVPVIEKLNSEGETHSKVSRSMLVPMPYSECPLEKSSKGTVVRSKAEKTYADCIERAYAERDVLDVKNCSERDVSQVVKDIVRSVLATEAELPEDTDFSDLGVDSVAGMHIRHKLTQLVPKDAPKLPISIVQDCGNISDLTKHLVDLRNGEISKTPVSETNQLDYMRRLVEDHSQFNKEHGNTPTGARGTGDVIVLTGATGALGAHVLNQLRVRPGVTIIYCLVRGADSHVARERVDKALKQRSLRPVSSSKDCTQIEVLRSALREPNLGLADETYRQIAETATVIMHLAWPVNFRMTLRSFAKDGIASVQNLINLALAAPAMQSPRFVFCSSVASAMAYSSPTVQETILEDPSVATNLGYSQSKWVAENICNQASQLQRLRGKVSIFRVGQLSGDTEYGIWNAKEAWPMMLSSVKLTGSLPDLADQSLSWLPVNVAATAMIEASLHFTPASDDLRVYHLLNDSASPTWSDMLCWLQKSVDFDILPPRDWIDRLEDAAARGSTHPALPLLDHWKATYAASGRPSRKSNKPDFEMGNSLKAMPALHQLGAVDEQYFDKLWTWIDLNM